jgi:hypothetical protein
MKNDKPYLKNLEWLMDFALPMNLIFEEVEISDNTIEEINKRCFEKNCFVSPESDGITIFPFNITDDVIPVLKDMVFDNVISIAHCGDIIASILRYEGKVLLQTA